MDLVRSLTFWVPMGFGLRECAHQCRSEVISHLQRENSPVSCRRGFEFNPYVMLLVISKGILGVWDYDLSGLSQLSEISRRSGRG